MSGFSFSGLKVILGLYRKCPQANEGGGEGVLMASEISPEATEKNLEGCGVRGKRHLSGSDQQDFVLTLSLPVSLHLACSYLRHLCPETVTALPDLIHPSKPAISNKTELEIMERLSSHWASSLVSSPKLLGALLQDSKHDRIL